MPGTRFQRLVPNLDVCQCQRTADCCFGSRTQVNAAGTCLCKTLGPAPHWGRHSANMIVTPSDPCRAECKLKTGNLIGSQVLLAGLRMRSTAESYITPKLKRDLKFPRGVSVPCQEEWQGSTGVLLLRRYRATSPSAGSCSNSQFRICSDRQMVPAYTTQQGLSSTIWQEFGANSDTPR